MSVKFKKLKLTLPKETEIINFNDCEIKVKKYLPINEKLLMVSDIINDAADTEMKYYNIGKVEVMKAIHVVERYTDITLDDKVSFDATYDLLLTSGLLDIIYTTIGKVEIARVDEILNTTVKNVYDYMNSASGILASVTKDYDNLEEVAKKLEVDISNPETVGFLKDVMTKMG